MAGHYRLAFLFGFQFISNSFIRNLVERLNPIQCRIIKSKTKALKFKLQKAEPKSVVLNVKKNGKEYIWQGNPKVWGSHAPVLFPIVGGLKNNTYYFENKTYQLPTHGFIRRNNDLTVTAHETNLLVLQLASNEKTKAVYPFDFIFQLSFELLSHQLKISHQVINTGDKKMYFSLGTHQAFICPLEDAKQYEDYHLQFETIELLRTWNLDENGQIKEEGDIIMDQAQKLQLHPHVFDQDALIFKSLKSK